MFAAAAAVSEVSAQAPGTLVVAPLAGDLDSDGCSVRVTAPGLFTVYVVHINTSGATYSRFRVVSGGGFNGVYQTENVLSPTYDGDTQTGIEITYGACLASPPFVVAMITYLFGSPPPPCSFLQVVADPEAPSGGIEVKDCTPPFPLLLEAPTYAPTYFNYTSACTSWCVLPVEPATWGAIKSLYNSHL